MNLRLWRWFDSGECVPALLGEGEFYIEDYTWRGEHDRLLVARQLIQWSRAQGKSDVARNGLTDALLRAVARNDARAAFDLILCYQLVNNEFPDWNVLGLDLDTVTEKLQQVLDRNKELGQVDSWLRDQVESVKGILPGLRGE